LEQLAELVAGVDALARGDRNGDRAGGFLQRGEVLGRDRFLDPGRLERFEVPGDLDGRRGIESTVHLDEDLDVRADGIAYRFDELDGACLFGAFHLVEPGAERVELERPVSLLERPFRGSMELLRRALDG